MTQEVMAFKGFILLVQQHFDNHGCCDVKHVTDLLCGEVRARGRPRRQVFILDSRVLVTDTQCSSWGGGAEDRQETGNVFMPGINFTCLNSSRLYHTWPALAGALFCLLHGSNTLCSGVEEFELDVCHFEHSNITSCLNTRLVTDVTATTRRHHDTESIDCSVRISQSSLNLHGKPRADQERDEQTMLSFHREGFKEEGQDDCKIRRQQPEVGTGSQAFMRV